jgi:tetratricopeptide (TPR) repeat protein
MELPMGRNQSPATRLQAARIAQGHTQQSVIHAMIQRATALNIPLAAPSSLPTMISRWENGHDQVTHPGYRRLFREILGRTNTELGFPEEPEDETTEELRQRLAVAARIDTATIELFRHQIDNIRHLDRKFGAASLLDQLTTHVTEIENLLTISPETPHRAKLAALLTDAASLAGWEALDRGALTRAWRLHETAKAAAREAGSPARLAYAITQQATILLDLGDTQAAAAQMAYARDLGTTTQVPALLATWLTAAHGEALAATGNQHATLTAFDKAHHLLPTDHNHPDLPFIMLNEAHLTRWRGAALARLGNKEAITELRHALRTLTTNTTRAQTSMLTDLAYAYAKTGERDAALSHATQARRLANQIGSDRQRRRLANLILPTGRNSTRTA